MILDSIIQFFYDIFSWLINLLPIVNQGLMGGGTLQMLEWFVIANYFIPVYDAVACMLLMISAYGGIFIYKGVKLIRGGG